MHAEVEKAITLKKEKSPGCGNRMGELLQNLDQQGLKIFYIYSTS